LAKGLFHRAIGESGARFARGVRHAEAEQAGVAFAKAAGGHSLNAVRALPPRTPPALPHLPPQENRDGWGLPDEVRAIFSSRRHNRVPMIVGSNADEMTPLATPASVPKTLEEFRKRVASQYGDSVKEFDALYPAATDAAVRDAWLASLRDAGMTLQMRTWARAVSGAGDAAYLYWFSHVAPHPNRSVLGAYHASEIQYVFNNLIRNWTYTVIDRQVADMMSTYWTNFAATADPNSNGLPRWSPYDTEGEAYMDFGDASVLRNHLRKAYVDF